MKQNYRYIVNALFFAFLVHSGLLAAEVVISQVPINVTERLIKPSVLFDGTSLAEQSIEMNSINSSDGGSLLNYFTGVNAASNAGTSSIPVIHGLSNDRIKIKVDGMDLIAACANHMNSPLSYTEPNKIKRIKVFAGITPVSMGGDSIGGTVMIDSVKPIFTKGGESLRKERVGIFYRSNSQTLGINLDATIASDQFFMNYNGSYEDAKNYKSGESFKADGLAATGRGWLKGDVVGSSAYKLSNQMMTLGLKKDNHLFDLKLSYQNIPFQGFSNQRMDSTKNESVQLNLGYEGAFVWGQLEARIYHEDTDHQHNFGSDKQYSYDSAVGMPMNAQGKNLGVSFKADLFFNEKDLVTIGAEIQTYDLDDWWNASGASGMMQPNDFKNINDGERNRLDVYAEWLKAWNPSWLTSLGLRYGQVRSNVGEVHGYQDNNGTMMMRTNYKADSDAFNASDRSQMDHHVDISILTQFTQNEILNYEMGYAMKNRSPNLYERYTWSTWTMAANMNNTYGDGNGYVGNLNLNPETSHTVSLSVDWHDMKKRTSSLRATSYFTYVIDYIDAVACTNVAKSCPTRTDGFSTLSFDNQSAKIYGFDLSVYQSLGIYSGLGQLSATGMVSYVRGENDDTNDNLFRQMPLNLKVSMDQQIGQWVNRIEGILVDEKSKVSGVRNEVKTSGYALLNIFSTYQYQQTRLTFGIINALDKNYNDPLGGAYLGQGATMKTGVSSGTAMPGMGRSFNVGLTFDF